MTLTNSQTAGEEEARFSYLQKPIRDLALNWNIDIAVELEDYLEELANVTISFDGGETKMNFAEAALLIQGSACVYSRKVEYLYDLAKHMLGLVGNKASNSQQNKAARDTTMMDMPAEEQFLTLDDITEHRMIVMKPGSEHNHIAVVPQTPVDLVKKVDLNESDITLENTKGETVGNRRDFKLNVCHQHAASGALLLDRSHLSLLDSTWLMSLSTSNSTNQLPRSEENTVEMSDAAASSVGTTDPVDPLPVDDILSMDDGADEQLDAGPPDVDPVSVCTQRLRMRREARKSTRPSNETQVANKLKLLSPFDECATTNRPKKIGRSYHLAPGIESDKSNKRKRNGASKDQAPLASIEDFCNDMYARSIPASVKECPSAPGLEQLVLAVHKKCEAVKKAVHRLMNLASNEADMADIEDDINRLASDPDQMDDVDDEGQSGIDPIAMDNIIGDMDANDSELNIMDNNHSSYEQLVRKYVDGYLASAEHYAQITELSKRVAEWEQKVIPKLNEEEQHGPYDIHVYGSQVIDRFSLSSDNEEQPSHDVAFSDVVRDQQPYQVCRLFLATLQLANNYNVEISSDAVCEDMDTMRLKLLSRRRHHEELATYTAPSLDTDS